ncbi:MAG: ATP-binding protein [Steroidobacteraceae bacterium]
MSAAPSADWQSNNQARLSAALAEIKSELRKHAVGISPASDEAAQSTGVARAIAADGPLRGADHPAAIDALCASFNLSGFERKIVLLCAGIELDSAFAPLCAAAQGEAARTYPTFSLALAVLSDAHWSALTPDGPLRRWRLIEVGAGPALTSAPLRIDERVLHFLSGIPHMDERLAAMLEPMAAVALCELSASHAALAQAILATWSAPRGPVRATAVQLCAADPMECRPIAAAVAAALKLRAIALPADLIPAASAEMEVFLRLWEREAVLGGALLVVEYESDPASADDARSRAVARFVERLDSLVIICAREPRRLDHRSSVKFDVARPTAAEQRSEWHRALARPDESTGIDTIASQFSMGLPAIRSAAAEALACASAAPGMSVVQAAWQSCRARCRTKLDGLAQRIDPAAGWEDIVLPAPQMQLLRQIAIQVRHRATVYDAWGFGNRSSRGLGIAALFAGASGTGKTMAAEVLAADLHLDLYRIDLATMVSKYIGETEKNLRKVFDAAEESGAILLFDEADALFGKRSEVKDSHDRYANVEVSYLLQRVEAYRGLAILTTNLKSAIDQSFVRRLRFIVQFPFPDAAQRAEIWRRIFPKETPTEGLDAVKLATANVAGGNIRNIALAAAFLAAQSGGSVRMRHLREAARTEYAKLEKPPNEAEIGSWI